MKKLLILFILGYAAASASGPVTIGVLSGDPLARIGVKQSDFDSLGDAGKVRFVQKTKYLDNAKAVVTHTMDDSNEFVLRAMEVMDKHGIKTTFFIGTQQGPIATMWPRLRQAIENGHEIGAHSQTHRCAWPATAEFCAEAYSDSEVFGARDEILSNTAQPYVWSWCYPCGLCAEREEVHKKLASAGYLVARNYPDEANDGHVVPDLQTYAKDWYNASYTQVAQKQGGIAKTGRTDAAVLNAKFDEVYRNGGIYSLMSHAQWLDLEPGQFYDKHLAYLGGRADVWYVPMGPLYAYKTIVDRTQIVALRSAGGTQRFAVYNDLDPKIYNGSVTLEFAAPAGTRVLSGSRELSEKKQGLTDRWSEEYVRRAGERLFVTVRPNSVLEFRRQAMPGR